jgi:hypothetical protein
MFKIPKSIYHERSMGTHYKDSDECIFGLYTCNWLEEGCDVVVAIMDRYGYPAPDGHREFLLEPIFKDYFTVTKTMENPMMFYDLTLQCTKTFFETYFTKLPIDPDSVGMVYESNWMDEENVAIILKQDCVKSLNIQPFRRHSYYEVGTAMEACLGEEAVIDWLRSLDTYIEYFEYVSAIIDEVAPTYDFDNALAYYDTTLELENGTKCGDFLKFYFVEADIEFGYEEKDDKEYIWFDTKPLEAYNRTLSNYWTLWTFKKI